MPFPLKRGILQIHVAHTRTTYNEFASFIYESRFSKKKNQKHADTFGAHQVDSLMVRGYLGFLHKKNQKVTIARKLSAVRSFFRYLVKHGVILDNPLDLILTPKQKKTIPVYLPVDDIFRLLDSIKTDTLAGTRNLAIFETLYSSGIRISELTGLNVYDVDFEQCLIRVLGKGDQGTDCACGKEGCKCYSGL